MEDNWKKLTALAKLIHLHTRASTANGLMTTFSAESVSLDLGISQSGAGTALKQLEILGVVTKIAPGTWVLA